MLKMPISVSDLNDEHLPTRPRGHVETTHQKKKREIELGTRALMNSVLYARCLVMVDGIHLDRMDSTCGTSVWNRMVCWLGCRRVVRKHY